MILLGARKGKYGPNGEIRAFPGANMPLAALGTFILWLGWFGFNGGSVLKLGDIASAHSVAMVFLNTNAAAAGGAVGVRTHGATAAERGLCKNRQAIPVVEHRVEADRSRIHVVRKVGILDAVRIDLVLCVLDR